MSKIINLIRSDLQDFNPYSSARCEAKTGRIWLNANEFPWNDKNDFLNRYPDQQPEILINKLTKYYYVNQNQILVTRGSDEGIDLLIRLFCHANKDAILICPPTFGMYEVSAKLQGAGIIKVPLKSKNFDLDINQILSKWNSSMKVIFLCSPNNPTGNLINTEKILHLCEKLIGKAVIVVDEAYIEFANTSSLSNYINDFSNLVILRTLSKAFGLAALRMGILLANLEIISWLKKILPPYPLATPCIKIAINTLEPNNLIDMQEKVNIIINERLRLFNLLNKINIIEKAWPSHANYIFIKSKQPIENECRKKGFILRNMEARTGIENSMRITVGTPNENSELMSLLREL